MLRRDSDATPSGPEDLLFLPESVLQDMSESQKQKHHRQKALYASQHTQLQQIVTLQFRMTGKDPLTVEVSPPEAANMPAEEAVLATPPQEGDLLDINPP